MNGRGNIQQRVFDAIPLFPVAISVVGLYAAIPQFDKESVRLALHNLRKLGLVEAVPDTKFSYRRTVGAQRPQERRGGKRSGAGRRALADVA